MRKKFAALFESKLNNMEENKKTFIELVVSNNNVLKYIHSKSTKSNRHTLQELSSKRNKFITIKNDQEYRKNTIICKLKKNWKSNFHHV